MTVNKINLTTTILVFAIFFLTTVYANGNPIALNNCLLAMETYCRVINPTAIDCARAAFKFWKAELPQNDMQEYYGALYKKLKIMFFESPTEYCQKRKNNHRQECEEDLKEYFTKDQSCNIEQQNHALRHAFFNGVLSCQCEEGCNTRETPKHKERNHTYEDRYILLIQKNIEFKLNMDSPEEFCRTKYEHGYMKPPFGVEFSLNIFNTDNRFNAVQECIIAMESYCEVEDPTPLDCARAAILFWQTRVSHNDVEEYYENLHENLILGDILWPAEYCHNKQTFKRSQCRLELREFCTQKRCSKEEQRFHAVRHAFFNTVFSCKCKGKCNKHSHKDTYILYMHEKIKVKDDMESPKDFCRGKHEPGYKKQV